MRFLRWYAKLRISWFTLYDTQILNVPYLFIIIDTTGSMTDLDCIDDDHVQIYKKWW